MKVKVNLLQERNISDDDIRGCNLKIMSDKLVYLTMNIHGNIISIPYHLINLIYHGDINIIDENDAIGNAVLKSIGIIGE